ncbi:MAG: AEC family transporter [bacterium]
MELIINSIVPVFLIVAMGYFFRKTKIIDDAVEKFLNNIAYYLLLPAMIFISIYKSPFETIVNIRMVVGIYAGAFIVFIIAAVIALAYPKEKRAGFVLPTFRTNIAYIGFPLILHAYGQLALAEISVLTGFIAPVTITFSIIYLKILYRDKDKNTKGIVYHVFTDPLVISSIVGIAFSYFKIRLPQFAVNTVDLISSMGSPLMLIAVGAGLKISTINKDKMLVVISSALKLIIQPAISFFIFTYLIPLTGLEFKVAVMTFSFPSALSTYIMVKQYKGDGELTAAIIMATTLLSILTMSAWILLLG